MFSEWVACPTLPTHTSTPTVPVRGITITSHSRSPKKDTNTLMKQRDNATD